MKQVYFIVLSLVAGTGLLFSPKVLAEEQTQNLSLENCKQQFSERGYPRRCKEIMGDYIHWIPSAGIQIERHPEWNAETIPNGKKMAPFFHFKKGEAAFIGQSTPSAKREVPFEVLMQQAHILLQRSSSWQEKGNKTVSHMGSRGFYIEGTYTHKQKNEDYYMRHYYFQINKQRFTFFRFVFIAPIENYQPLLQEVEEMLYSSEFLLFKDNN